MSEIQTEVNYYESDISRLVSKVTQAQYRKHGNLRVRAQGLYRNFDDNTLDFRRTDLKVIHTGTYKILEVIDER